MAKKKLSDREIENLLIYEDIPSDTDSCAGGDGSDEDEPDIEDVPLDSQQFSLGENIFPSDEEFDSDDEAPLSHLLGRNQPTTEGIPLLALGVGPPKWKKAYTILAPENFTTSNHLPDETTSLAAHQQLPPLKIFNLLWTDEIMRHVTFHTNLYAEQKGITYKPVTTDEISVFIALNLVMGVKKSPSYRGYFGHHRLICEMTTYHILCRSAAPHGFLEICI